jgi:hypothetical protein
MNMGSGAGLQMILKAFGFQPEETMKAFMELVEIARNVDARLTRIEGKLDAVQTRPGLSADVAEIDRYKAGGY